MSSPPGSSLDKMDWDSRATGNRFHGHSDRTQDLRLNEMHRSSSSSLDNRDRSITRPIRHRSPPPVMNHDNKRRRGGDHTQSRDRDHYRNRRFDSDTRDRNYAREYRGYNQPRDYQSGDNFDRRDGNRNGYDSNRRDRNRDGYDSDRRASNHDDRGSDRGASNYDGYGSDSRGGQRDGYGSDSRGGYRDGYGSDRQGGHRSGYSSNRHREHRVSKQDRYGGFRPGDSHGRRHLEDKRDDSSDSYASYNHKKASLRSDKPQHDQATAPQGSFKVDNKASGDKSSVTKNTAKGATGPSVRFNIPPENDDPTQHTKSNDPASNDYAEPMVIDVEEEEDQDAIIERRQRLRAELVAKLTKEASFTASPQDSTAGPQDNPVTAVGASPGLTPISADVSPQAPGELLSKPAQQDQHESPPVDSLEQQASQAAEEPAAAGGDDDDDDDDFDIFADTLPKPKSKPALKVMEGAKNRIATVERSTKEGYFSAVAGELVANRYKVEDTTSGGKGSFAVVVKAFDVIEQRAVALKMSRDRTEKTLTLEADINEKIAYADPDGTSHIVRYFGTVSHRGFNGLVFEWMESNLHQTITQKGYLKVRLATCQAYAQQLFLALKFLKEHKFIHKDIKPMNVLVRKSAKQPEIKVCDLGTYVRADEPQPESTRHMEHGTPFYRPPEVFLGWAHSYPYDMWTVGCTLFEAYTGEYFVKGNDNGQLLQAIIAALGISQSVIRRSPREFRDAFFDDKFNFIQQLPNSVLQKVETKLVKVHPEPAPGKDIASRIIKAARDKEELFIEDHLNLFIDLLRRCLAVDPDKRITPEQALEHDFITKPPHPFMRGKPGAK